MKKILISFAIFMLLIIFIPLMMINMFANSDETDSESEDVACSVVSGDTKLTTKEFDVAKFKKEIQAKGHAYKDKVDKIIEVANKAGVNPALMAAIMASETGWGVSDAIKYDNNPSGQMNSQGVIHYETLDKGIEATGKTLRNLVVERKLDTIAKLGSAYAPVGASNDSQHLNNNWVPTVSKIMEQLGGNVDKIFTGGGCESDVQVTGEKMNYFDEMFERGKSVIGTPYSLGAAQTMSDHPAFFDCGSFTLWLFQKQGISVKFNRIAQDQYNKTTHSKEAKAGDLIFFQKTYDTGRGEVVTHVGLVVSKTQFIGANGSGVGIANFTSGYWKQHFYAFGRVK